MPGAPDVLPPEGDPPGPRCFLVSGLFVACNGSGVMAMQCRTALVALQRLTCSLLSDACCPERLNFPGIHPLRHGARREPVRGLCYPRSDPDETRARLQHDDPRACADAAQALPGALLGKVLFWLPPEGYRGAFVTFLEAADSHCLVTLFVSATAAAGPEE